MIVVLVELRGGVTSSMKLIPSEAQVVCDNNKL